MSSQEGSCGACDGQDLTASRDYGFGRVSALDCCSVALSLALSIAARMPPRRGGSRGGAGRGRGSGRGDGGGGELPGSVSGVGGGSSGGGDIDSDMDIIDVDPLRPHSTAHVDVVYVEQPLRRAEAVPERGPIRGGWLQGCVHDSLEEWQEHLPGVAVEDLRGTMIPGSARTYPDLAQGRGLVTVELEDRGSDKGILTRLATAQGRTLIMEQLVADTRRQMLELEARVEARAEARADEARRGSQIVIERLLKQNEEQEGRMQVMETEVNVPSHR